MKGPHEYFGVISLIQNSNTSTSLSNSQNSILNSMSSASYTTYNIEKRSSLPSHTYIALRSFHGTYVGVNTKEKNDLVMAGPLIVCNAKKIGKTELFQPFTQVLYFLSIVYMIT